MVFFRVLAQLAFFVFLPRLARVFTYNLFLLFGAEARVKGGQDNTKNFPRHQTHKKLTRAIEQYANNPLAQRWLSPLLNGVVNMKMMKTFA